MAELKMAAAEMAGGGGRWRSKDWGLVGGHTCVCFQVDMLRRGLLLTWPRNCQRSQAADEYQVGGD